MPVDFPETLQRLFEPIITEAQGAVGAKHAGRPTAKQAWAQTQLRTLEKAKEKALACFKNRIGWLCLFYRDEHHRILSIKLRKPFTKDFLLYKPFPRCGVFGADVFTPFESEKYQEENRLIVVEGDFNALALWSAELRYAEKTSVEKRFHHACAVGGVDAADLATVRAIGPRPLFIYDNDAAGFGLVEKARESMHLDAATTPGADSDLDSFISGFGSEIDIAWREIGKVIANRESFPRSHDSVAAEIYRTRQKQEGADHRRDFEINNQVAEIIYTDLQERGRFLSSDTGPYFFLDETKSLIPIDKNNMDFHILLNRYSLNSSEKLFLFVVAHLALYTLEHGNKIEVRRIAHFDPAANVLYVWNHNSTIYRVTEAAIEIADNGTEDVFFGPSPAADPFQYDPTSLREDESPLQSYLVSQVALAPGLGLTDEEGRQVLSLYLYHLFFGCLMRTGVLLVFEGEKGSRKTVSARKIGWLLFGQKFDVSPMPEERKDFEALLTNRPFVVLDNCDSPEPWLENLLAVAASKGKIPRREYYSTNNLIDYPLDCFISLTCRTPKFTRDDVADRVLLIQTERSGDFRPQFEVEQEFLTNRNAMMTELLNDLQGVVAALKKTQDYRATTPFRMADFAAFCLRIARANNQEEGMAATLAKLSHQQAAFNLENEQSLVDILVCWANTGINSTRYLTNTELHPELAGFCKEHGITFEYEGPKKLRSFTTKMGLLRVSMGKLHFDILQKDLGSNRHAYRYVPKKEG